MVRIDVRNKTSADNCRIKELLKEYWGKPSIVTRGKITEADKIPAIIACIDDKPVGLVTYRIDNDSLEIITLNSEKEGIGIGTALINKVINIGKKGKCKRVWVITTNDNLAAISFYKRRGFLLKTIYKNAIDESRKLKPEIPMTGIGGVPIRDELEFEFQLY